MSLINLHEGQVLYHKSGIRGVIVAIHEYSADDILISLKFDESLSGSSDISRFRPSSIGKYLFHSIDETNKGAEGQAKAADITSEAQLDSKALVMKNGLEPVINSNSNILILGTLPGDESIATKEYYADSSNQFWKVIYGVFDDSDIPSNYDEKLGYLKEKNIALWDVLAAGVREGSSDKNIKDPLAHDFNSLFKRYEGIEMVAFNGLNTEKYYNRLVSPTLLDKSKLYITLPSTSGSNTRMTIQEKIEKWGKLKG